MNPETRQDYSDQIVKPTQLFPLVRHLSYRLTPILLNISLVPNQVTSISMVMGLSGAACFAFGNMLMGIIGALLLTASYTLDNCDGEIARIKKMSSEFGARLDDISDWIVDMSFFVALGYGTTQATDQAFWAWIGYAAAAGAFIDYMVDLHFHAKNTKDAEAKSREEVATDTRQPQDTLDWMIYIFHKLSRADFCLIVLGLALFDVTWILLPFAAIGAQVYWITDLFERARGYHT